MKLDIKKPIVECEIKKEERNMVDIPVSQELAEDNIIVPIKVVINASIGINSKQKINGELK